MITIDVRSTVAELQKAIEQARGRSIPKVQEVALNWTATEIKNGLVAEMQRVFDRPTPFTLDSLYIDPADVGRLEAHIYFKDFAPKGQAAGQYLRAEIQGGQRRLKRFESALRATGLLPAGLFAVPSAGAPLDAWGNVPAAFLIRLLSDLRAFAGDSRYANRKAGRRKGTKAQNAFFVASRTDRRTAHLRPGIYWRLPNRTLILVFVFTRTPGYAARFKFFEVGQRIALEQYPIRYARAWEWVFKKGLA
ncbi:MAG: hypothetical protein U1E23_14715 [Reyranellaceae bacterium]